jgi:hypothetical protein
MTTHPSTASQLARFSFRGPYRGETLEWTVTVATLAHWRAHPPTEAHRRAARRSFIQVTGRVGPRLYARVGLPVTEIDQGVLAKTRIMLTGWRRIGAGLHPYGPPAENSP